jgi:hypothetical protein
VADDDNEPSGFSFTTAMAAAKAETRGTESFDRAPRRIQPSSLIIEYPSSRNVHIRV